MNKTIASDRSLTTDQFSLFVEYSPIAIAMFDRNMRYLLASKHWLKDYGLENQEIIGRSQLELFPHLAGFWQQIYDQCLMGINEKEETDIRLELEGEIDWLKYEVSPWHTVTGEVGGIIIHTEIITERKQKEKILFDSELKFRKLYESTDDAVTIFNNREFIDCNPAALEIFGCVSKDQFCGKHPSQFSPPYQPNGENSASLATEMIQTAFQTGTHRFEWMHSQLDGKEFPAEVTLTPITIDSQTFLQGIVRNISDRKAAEKALLENQELYHFTFENAAVGVAYNSLDGRYLRVNPAWAEILGYSVEELSTKTYLDVTQPEDLALDSEQMERLMAGAVDRFSIEKRYIRKDKSIIWVNLSVSLMRDSLGVPQYTIAVLEDISDRKAAEKTQARLTAILEATTDFVGITDDLGNILYINQAGQKMLGIPNCSDTQSSLIDHYITTTVGDKMILEAIPTAIRDGIWSGESLLRNLDGKEIPVSQVIMCHKSSSGEIEYLSTIARDITERRQSETELKQKAQELEQTLRELQNTQSQLVQTEKMSSLGQLVAGVAHEINNPVNFIYGNLIHATDYTRDLLNLLSLYQKHYPNPVSEIQAEAENIDLEFLVEDLSKLLNSMKIGAERIQKIVLSLRNFSRMDEAEFKAVDIHEGIDSTLMILQNRLKAKSDFPEIRIVREYSDLPKIECYAGQLNQVFMNILANAIDAIEEKGTGTADNPKITISTALKDNNCISICITDNGTGIPENIRLHLFDPFFTTKPVGKGTGLGLSISYQIITEKHNGNLQVFSEAGKGTQFSIEIPIKRAA